MTTNMQLSSLGCSQWKTSWLMSWFILYVTVSSICQLIPLLPLCSFSDGQITAILDQKNYVEELNRHLRLYTVNFFLFCWLSSPCIVACWAGNSDDVSVSVCSASVNNLQAKVDALEKSNTKLTEEVRAVQSWTLKRAFKFLTSTFLLKMSSAFSALLYGCLYSELFADFCPRSSQWQITGSSLYKKTWRE